MKRSEVRTFIRDGVEALPESIGFSEGQLTEFNATRSNSYPFVFCETITNTPEITEANTTVDNYDITLHICKKDATDSVGSIYESIIDDCDDIARKLMYQYNFSLESAGNVTISSYTRTPFIKDHADCLTGVILQFTLTAYDRTDVC